MIDVRFHAKRLIPEAWLNYPWIQNVGAKFQPTFYLDKSMKYITINVHGKT